MLAGWSGNGSSGFNPDLGLPSKDELLVRDTTLRRRRWWTRAPLDIVLEQMASRHAGSVLVTRGGQLAGIFTATDACRAFCAHLRRLSGAG
jgi:hypothetical protein